MHNCFTGGEVLNKSAVDKWDKSEKISRIHNYLWISKADSTAFLARKRVFVHSLWITLETRCDPVDKPVTLIEVHYIKHPSYPQILFMKQISCFFIFLQNYNCWFHLRTFYGNILGNCI